MAPSITTIESAFLALYKTSVASSAVAVRAALGNGANSIIRADDLTKDTIPTLPCLALRYQNSGGSRDDVQRYYPFIYIYDALPKYWIRINTLLPLLKAVVYEVDCIPYCETDYRQESGEITDKGLGLRCKYLPFVIATR